MQVANITIYIALDTCIWKNTDQDQEISQHAWILWCESWIVANLTKVTLLVEDKMVTGIVAGPVTGGAGGSTLIEYHTNLRHDHMCGLPNFKTPEAKYM